MIKFREYTADDKMISLISDNYHLLQVLSRFGIPLGFSDNTISEVCLCGGVDCDTFLAIVNFLNENSANKPDISRLSLKSLLHYLKQSHIYFLNFYLPSIRRKLLEAINLKDSEVSFLIIKLFDEYVDSIRRHMEEEERYLFKDVEALIEHKGISGNKSNVYSHHHEEVGSKFRELKNIIIKYCPPDSSANLLNDTLYDIYRCEEELSDHCMIEDHLLVPAIIFHKNCINANLDYSHESNTES